MRPRLISAITCFFLTLVAFGLIGTGWLVNISYLTKKLNQARIGKPSVTPASPGLPMSMELQEAIDDYSNQMGGIGLQITIIFPDGITWNGVAGYADIENRCPIHPRHHLYIGSMTKLFTAALVMEQVERGALSLDDPVERWVPLVDAKDITIRTLLNHTSGLPDYARDPWFQIRWFGLPRKTWRPDELVRVIHDKPTRFFPGSRHAYSNSNYLLLGMILEKATGKPFSVILEETVRTKLGLYDTYFLSYPDDLPIANGYDESLLHLGRRNLTGFRRSLESGAFTAGGILSTSEDVARFVHALFTRQVISGASLEEMKTFVNAPDEDIPEQTG